MRKTLKTISKTLGGGPYRNFRNEPSSEERFAKWLTTDSGLGELKIKYRYKDAIYNLDSYRIFNEDERFKINKETENFKKNFREEYRTHFNHWYHTSYTNKNREGPLVYYGDLEYGEKVDGKGKQIYLIEKRTKKDELNVKIAYKDDTRYNDYTSWYIEEDGILGKYKTYYNLCQLSDKYYLAYSKETGYDNKKKLSERTQEFIERQCEKQNGGSRSKRRKNRRSRKI